MIARLQEGTCDPQTTGIEMTSPGSLRKSWGFGEKGCVLPRPGSFALVLARRASEGSVQPGKKPSLARRAKWSISQLTVGLHKASLGHLDHWRGGGCGHSGGGFPFRNPLEEVEEVILGKLPVERLGLLVRQFLV
jgi:hypothetical protein